MQFIPRYLTFITILVLFLGACKKGGDTQRKQTIDIPCIPASLQSGIIAFYPFVGGSIKDFSGNHHDLTNNSTASSGPDRSGNTNCAFEFNNITASGEMLFTARSSFLDSLSQYSVSLWYMPLDTNKNIGTYEVLVARDTVQYCCSDKSGQWSLDLYDCRRAVFGRLDYVWDNAIIPHDCAKELIARTGSWHHMVATYDGNNNGEMKIYRDGILQQTAHSGGTTLTIQDIGIFVLGRRYTGRLDDVIIYNRDA